MLPDLSVITTSESVGGQGASVEGVAPDDAEMDDEDRKRGVIAN